MCCINTVEYYVLGSPTGIIGEPPKGRVDCWCRPYPDVFEDTFRDISSRSGLSMRGVLGISRTFPAGRVVVPSLPESLPADYIDVCTYEVTILDWNRSEVDNGWAQIPAWSVFVRTTGAGSLRDRRKTTVDEVLEDFP